jgi:hypothetical protein
MLTDNANTVQSQISLRTLITALNDALGAFSTALPTHRPPEG